MMCWISIDKNDSVCHMANKDIKVFKIMKRVMNDDSYFYSYFQNYIYRQGRRYTDEIKLIALGNCLRINHGYHSYSSEDCHVEIEDNIRSILVCPTNGIGLNGRYKNDFDVCVVKCIIPQGSKYYKNSIGEIVSDSIIIESEILEKDLIEY